MGQSPSNRRRHDHHHQAPPFIGAAAPYAPPPPSYYTPQPSYYAPNSGYPRQQPLPPPVVPPPFVEHAKTVKNAVNVHKETVKLEVDDRNHDHRLVSFQFDALTDGSFTIYYFAKEQSNCSLSPVYPDMYVPTTVPFHKGSGQKFRQPSGTGIDLGFFELDHLLKPLDGDVFPLVIYAEACPHGQLTDEQPHPSKAATNAQITLAVLGKHDDGSFEVKVMKQILWCNGERYEIEKIFGLANSAEGEGGASGGAGSEMEKECVICLTEPSDTAVLPCRHMCMCSGCAKEFRLQSDKCPVCRQPVEKLMEIKVSSADR